MSSTASITGRFTHIKRDTARLPHQVIYKGKGRANPSKTRAAHYPARLNSAQKGRVMTTQDNHENQPILFMDDESRLVRLEGISEEAREWLADLFIVLRRGMTKEGAGPQVVHAELDRFIELLFQGSEAYRLALKLYAGRYEVIGARSAAEILREAIEKYMPDSDRQAVSKDSKTDGEPDE